MRRVPGGPLFNAGPIIGFVASLGLLGALMATAGLSGYGWALGVLCALGTNGALLRGITLQAGRFALGPADWVTLVRSVLVAGVAALATEAMRSPGPVSGLVALCTVALVLDAVDGEVARRTGTASALGARFDMEVDALLILVLSVYVASTTAWWVIAIGAARYLFVGARWVLPWLHGSAPPRYWCKVVAAIQGVVLTVAAAGVLPHAVSVVLLAVSLVLLMESFGRETWELWRAHGHEADSSALAASTVAAKESSDGSGQRRRGLRAAVSVVASVLACLTVWFALVFPNEIDRLTPATFLSIPIEGLFLVALALVLPNRAVSMASALFGLALGLLVIVKILDMGFFVVFDRPFDPVNDWAYLRPGAGVLSDSVGQGWAIAAAVAAAVLVVLILVVTPLSALRLARLAAAHRPTSMPVAAGLAVVWSVCAVSGLQFAPGTHVASTSAASLAYGQVSQLRDNIKDRKTFAAEIAVDDFRNVPADDLLTRLRGKDVLLVFVESYGRVAVEDPAFSKHINPLLDDGSRRLRSAGFSSRSAYLTSPTFGAASWLAHSTLQSGLWVDSQQRYNQLLTNERVTLTSAFGSAGWRTVFDVPANTHDWPEGAAFYSFDELYDSRNVGYVGPKFGYATMPDQYTLSAFRRLELAQPDRKPVMAEIDLVSSHHPWTPLPRLVDWTSLGNGSVFDAMAEGGSDDAGGDSDSVRALYRRSIEYSLNTVVSFVEEYPDPNLVLVVVGDHQPHSYVSGDEAGHDVPISIIAHDPAVVDQISGWGWEPGMSPGPEAPVLRMDSFRDRFLTAFGR